MKLITRLLGLYERVAESLQSPFLAAMRVYFGWQLFETGRGKFEHMTGVVAFFGSLGIPFPSFNAHLVAGVETIGGLLLIAGLAARLMALPITISMTVAYLTADMDAVRTIFSSPDAFVKASPFPFWITAIIILAFGPGKWSLDALIARMAAKKRDAKTSVT